MDERIEAFLRDVLSLEGENSNVVREGVRRHLAEYEKQFRNAETDERMKDRAVEACQTLCRSRLLEEIPRHKGTPTADHLKLVLSVVEGPARLLN
jgi:hypothetical protein